MMRLGKSPGEILLCLVALIGLIFWARCHKQEGAAPACDLDRLADTLAAIVEEYPGEIGVAVITGEGDTWSPMLKEHAGDEFSVTVRELLRYTLAQSDNNASNLMFGRLVGVGQTDSVTATIIPRESFRIAYSEAEMSADHDRAYANTTSPSGAAVLINRLYTDSLVSADKQAFIAETLRECRTGADRIAAPLAGIEGVTVGHKTGSGYINGDGELVAHNDVAYITLPGGRSYALAVFVKDFRGDEKEAARAIARISAAVYAVLSRK